MVGKPLFQRHTGTYWGAWMKDPNPYNEVWAEKYWFTRHFTGKVLFEYRNLDDFRQDRNSKTYQLKEIFFGTGHVINKGSFYYHRAGHREIVRYDLRKEATVAKRALPKAGIKGKAWYLYSTEYTYIDLAVDETGLWAIYGHMNRAKVLKVAKLDPETLSIEKVWSIPVEHQNFGNGFITCGILYMIQDTHVKNTIINFGYDLYKDKKIDIRLKFTNPFKTNNMISYNPREQKIYGWDRGSQLTYPLLITRNGRN